MVTFFEKVRQHFSFLFLVVVTPCCSTTTKYDNWVVDNKIIDKAFAKTEVEKLTLTEESFTNTIREIGNSFLGAKKATVKELTLALPSLTTIGSDFCSESDSLEKVTLNLSALECIGDLFLYNCKNLTDLEGVQERFTSLKKIGNNFLEKTKLREFRLETTKLKELGDDFLFSCKQLSTVELNFTNLQKINNGFLTQCSALKKVTLTLPNVTEIKVAFLAQCTKLKELTLTLPKVTEIGDLFLSKAWSLKQLNLNLTHIEKIGTDFLAECTKLKKVTLTLPKVTEIEGNFLSRADSLEMITLDLPALTSIGPNFLAGGSALKKVTLTLPNVTEIGGSFLSNAISLEEITLELPPLKKIDFSFLADCSALKKVALTLPNVTEIGGRFLSNAASLEEITLELPALEKIGNDFLAECSALKRVTLKLLNVTGIEYDFLSEASSLKELTLYLPTLTSIGPNFLADCPAIEKLELTLPDLNGLNSSALEQLNRSTLTLNLKDLKKADSKILGNLGKVKKLTIVAPELTEIEEGCLLNCPSLEEVRFEFPKLVGTSDNCWLEGCNNLTYFSLRAPLLKKINKASLPNNEGLKELDLSGCTALESTDLDLLDKQENSISTLLPSSLQGATLSDQQSTTADNTPPSGYANWILPSTLLLGVGGILCFLYYSQPIKKKRTKKKAKEPEEVPNASVTNEERKEGTQTKRSEAVSSKKKVPR